MNKRKLLCLLLTVMMVVLALFSTVYADEDTTVTTASGITISIPSDYGWKMWDSMTEEEAAENGLEYASLQQLRDSIGLELSFTYPYATNMNYSVAINEIDAPADNEDIV